MCALPGSDVHFGPYVLVVNYSARVAKLLEDALRGWHFSNPRLATRARMLVLSSREDTEDDLPVQMQNWPEPFRSKADFPPEWFSDDDPFGDSSPRYARIGVDFSRHEDLEPLTCFADKISVGILFMAEPNGPGEQEMLLLVHCLADLLPKTILVAECQYRRTVSTVIAAGAHEAFSREGVEYDVLQSEILQSPLTDFLQEVVVPSAGYGEYRNSKLCVHNLAIDANEEVVINSNNRKRFSELADRFEVLLLGFYVRRAANTVYRRFGEGDDICLRAGDSVVLLCPSDEQFRDFSDAFVSVDECFLRRTKQR